MSEPAADKDRLARLPGLLDKLRDQAKFEFTDPSTVGQESRTARGLTQGFTGLQTILRDKGEAGLHEALSNKGKLEAMGFSRNTAAALQESTADFMDGKINEYKASRSFGDAVKTEVGTIRAAAAVREAHIASPTEAHGRIAPRTPGRAAGMVAFLAATGAAVVALFASDKPSSEPGARSASGVVTVVPAEPAAASAIEMPTVITTSLPAVAAASPAVAPPTRPASARPSRPEIAEPEKPDAQVVDMQNFMLELGDRYQRLMSDGATGLRGQQFANALRLFQHENKLPVTGAMDRDTILQVNEIRQGRAQALAEAPAVDMSALQVAESKPDVVVQRPRGPEVT
jgi:hypothetical protein